MKATISNQQEALAIQKGWFRALVRHVLDAEGVADADISLAFVDDATIHRLNRQFLNHDFATDVLTFPYHEGKKKLAGEIVISAEHAVREAPQHGWSAEMEASLYVVHGLLHLCGYRDDEDAKAEVMSKRQEELLKRFALEEESRPPREAPSHS